MRISGRVYNNRLPVQGQLPYPLPASPPPVMYALIVRPFAPSPPPPPLLLFPFLLLSCFLPTGEFKFNIGSRFFQFEKRRERGKGADEDGPLDAFPGVVRRLERARRVNLFRGGRSQIRLRSSFRPKGFDIWRQGGGRELLWQNVSASPKRAIK